jgi:hypothetical protein
MTVGVARKGDGLRRKEGSGTDKLEKVFWVGGFKFGSEQHRVVL